MGVDINKNSVENANKRIEEYGLDKSKIRFEYGNAEELNFEDNEFGFTLDDLELPKRNIDLFFK